MPPIERVVAVLTPLFAALAAWLTGLIGSHFPGVNVDPSQVVALEVAGFTGATAAALKWLHGRQKYVTLTDDAKKAVEDALQKVRAETAANPQLGVALSDIKQLLTEHATQAEQDLEAHVPAVVAQSLAALFAQGAQPQAPPAVPPPVAS